MTKRSRWSDRDLEYIRKIYGYVPVSEIAKAYNVSPETIYSVAHRQNMVVRKDELIGIDCDKVRRLIVSGMPSTNIARELKLISPQVNWFVKNKLEPVYFDILRDNNKRKAVKSKYLSLIAV